MADDVEPPLPAARPYLEYRPLLRAPGIASDSRKLVLAAAGLLGLYAGWAALGHLFAGPTSLYDPDSTLPGAELVEGLPDFSASGLWEAAAEVTGPFRTLAAPLAAVFTKGLGPKGWLQAALMGVWAAIVWGIAGGAIARIAVVQAATGAQVGVGTAARFALGRSASLIGAPLTPMLAVAILAGCCALFGLLSRMPAGIGPALAAGLGFVPLLLALVMALILVGLSLGWPLMHATVAAEGEDAPDALSRSYSYVNQRLVRYAAHAAFALLIGAVGLMAAMTFGRIVLGLADWGISLGAPPIETLGESARLGRVFWSKVVGLFVLAWVYSYFWSAASVIYLILRRDVDGTAWHDVYLPEHAADTFAGEPAPAPTGPAVASKPVDAEIG